MYDIYELFDGLNVKDLDVEVPADAAAPASEQDGASTKEAAAKN